MSIAQHAERILAAWNVADAHRFEAELDNALRRCQENDAASMLDAEQEELLLSVVDRLRGKCDEKTACFRSAHSLSAGLALLRHLSHRSLA